MLLEVTSCQLLDQRVYKGGLLIIDFKFDELSYCLELLGLDQRGNVRFIHVFNSFHRGKQTVIRLSVRDLEQVGWPLNELESLGWVDFFVVEGRLGREQSE